MKDYNKIHYKEFKKECTQYFGPGHLKLMGDYTNHTGGKEISCLLTVGARVTVNKSSELGLTFFVNETKDEIIEFDYSRFSILNEKSYKCLCGLILNEYLYNMKLIVGVEGFIHLEDVHTGIDVVPGFVSVIVRIINHFNFLNLPEEILKKICHNVLNKYYHTNVPYDLSVFKNTRNKATLIDKRNNNLLHANVNFEDFSLLIIYDKNLNEDTEFLCEDRRYESKNAHVIVDSRFKHEFLCDFNINELNECKDEVRDFEFKRIRHAISENNRVDELFHALNDDDIVKVGMILTQSQISLLQDYEISTKNQDALCMLVSRYNALGSKMIASKYNSSVVVLVKDLQIPNLIKKVSLEYKNRFNSEVEFLIANIYT